MRTWTSASGRRWNCWNRFAPSESSGDACSSPPRTASPAIVFVIIFPGTLLLIIIAAFRVGRRRIDPERERDRVLAVGRHQCQPVSLDGGETAVAVSLEPPAGAAFAVIEPELHRVDIHRGVGH